MKINAVKIMIGFHVLVASYLIIFLITSAKAASILGIFPIGAKSHYGFDRSIMKSLHAAGHDVTIICPFEESDIVENYTVISMSFAPLESTTQGSIEEFVKLPLSTYFRSAMVLMQQYCDNFLSSKYFEDIFNSPKIRFDVLIIEYIPVYPCLTIVAEKFDIPIIVTSPIQSAFYIDSLFGNPSHPAAIPAGFSYVPQRMGFLQRLENTAYRIYQDLLFRYVVLPKVDRMSQRIQDDFGITSKRSFSLVFQNSHSSLSVRPMVQNVIEVGGIHMQPSKILPEIIKKFIDESRAGVILFTFGSIARGSFLSPRVVNMFKEVFSQIPQRVIWKYEETIVDLPENVMVSDWIPQRDILAHKNVVAFITHCGIGGIYEAIYESVPLVMIPFYGDQLPNAAALEEKGVGMTLSALELSTEKIKNALDLVVNDTRYRKNMQQLSRRFKDRPMTPQESVVYWTEYVISHQGALHLRSYLADMPLYQYYFLDILSVIALIFLTLYSLFYLFMRYFSHKIVGDTKKKQN